MPDTSSTSPVPVSAGAAGTGGTTYRLDLPWETPPLSLNDRRNRFAFAQLVAVVRETAGWRARGANVGRHNRVRVTLHYQPLDRRRRDEDNLVATLKPLCDGLVDAGVVPDDTPNHMVKVMPIIHEPDGIRRCLWLDVQVLTDSPAGAPEGSRQPSPAGGTTPEPFRVEAVCRPDSPVTHDLKTWASVYSAVAAGDKRFEIRRNDRDYRVGDLLRLEEYDPDTGEYTGRGCVRRVVHLLPGGQFGLADGHVAMSLAVVDGQGRSPDWHRIAVQIARYGGSYYGLKTWERDALELEVKAVNEADADVRFERMTDAADRGEHA